MNMLEIHKTALEDILPVYHEFLGKYKKSTKCVYGFVEGIEDPSFYQGFIEHVLPQDWEVTLWPAGKKDKVLKLYSRFNWNCFPKCQIAFFIDRDLSEFIREIIPNEINIYITENYSIENDIVNRTTCKRVLNEVFNLSTLSINDQEKILDLFDKELRIFLKAMIPIMAWIIHWRRLNYQAFLDSIEMKHIFSISEGKINIMNKPKGKNSIQEYIHSQCDLEIDESADIPSIEKGFKANNKYKHFTRGKYVFWFLVEFTKTVHRDITKIAPSVKSSPKIHINLSQSNGVLIIGPRARIPRSLKTFLNNSYCTYVKEIENIA